MEADIRTRKTVGGTTMAGGTSKRGQYRSGRGPGTFGVVDLALLTATGTVALYSRFGPIESHQVLKNHMTRRGRSSLMRGTLGMRRIGHRGESGKSMSGIWIVCDMASDFMMPCVVMNHSVCLEST